MEIDPELLWLLWLSELLSFAKVKGEKLNAANATKQSVEIEDFMESLLFSRVSVVRLADVSAVSMP
jgi:hypothetical protein